MKKVFAFVALLMCSPIAAAAQAVPPVPRVPPVPPAPVVAPTPPVPVAPHTFVMVPPVIDHMAIDDAVRASREALSQLDMQAIRDQAREAAETARASVAHMRDFAMPFDFDYQGRTFTMGSSSEDGQYQSGLSYISRYQYEQAVTAFDRSIAQKGPHTDGALYWKAFAQYKLGKKDDALASLAELRKAYAQSRYKSDAEVLEADVKKSSGQPMDTDANNTDIKLLAIQSLQNTDPVRAIPLLEAVLKATNSLRVKKQALFVLAQNDQAGAHQILMNYAKGGGNPDLQTEAIRYLVQRRSQTTSAELQEIYKSTQDENVKRAVLDAFVSSGDKTAIMTIARPGNSPVAIRSQAISRLGNSSLATPQELMQLYQGEEEKELRITMIRALANMGAVDQLSQIIKTEKDPAVRLQAIRSLGNMKTERTGQSLVELYGTEQDKEARKSVISALSNQNNAEGLVAIARKETSSDLKVEIVRKLADMAKTSKVASDYLMELIK